MPRSRGRTGARSPRRLVAFLREQGACPRQDRPAFRHWQVTLKVFYQSKNSVNAPYSFRAEAVGFFSVVESYSEDRAEWLVKTNASSVLYSVVREALRNAMATGPWKPIILPAVSFYAEEARKFLKAKTDG